MQIFKGLKDRYRYSKWLRSGRPLPPPELAKRKMLLEYAQKYKLTEFVETGTLHGDTTNAMCPYFDRLWTIELAPHFHAAAVKRFRGIEKMNVLQGNSGEKMAEVVPQLQGATLFWLDGHYSGGDTALGEFRSPIWAELDGIFSFIKHPFVILIDDARLFINEGEKDYPAISDIEEWLQQQSIQTEIEVDMDCIRITPKSSA